MALQHEDYQMKWSTRYKGIKIRYYVNLDVYQAVYDNEQLHSDCINDMISLLNCRLYCRYTV